MDAIAVDAMGGDHGPKVAVAGAAEASLSRDPPRIVLVGDQAHIHSLLKDVEHDRERIDVVHAKSAIPMDCDAKKALDANPEASVLVAARLVRDQKAAALVSAGNTAAVILACARTFDRLPGVSRCALGAVFPTERRRGEKDDPFSLILDAGLTVDVTADDLVGFAIMGSAYASRVARNNRPRVALLSNGSEEGKGTAAIKEAHQRLKKIGALPPAKGGIHFIGNIEGMDIPRGTADVVVTGGFTGNIVLKMLEGIADTVSRLGRYAFKQNLMYKAGLTLLAPAVKQLKAVTDWEQYGGAPVLGFDHLCIKAHGRSSPRALKNAIKVANKTVQTDLLQAIREGVAASQSAVDASVTAAPKGEQTS